MLEEKSNKKITSRPRGRTYLRRGGISYKEGDIEFEDLGVPHQPPKTIHESKMAVYSFFYNGQKLKIEKAGLKSKSRYTSQHYSSGSAPSKEGALTRASSEAVAFIAY